MNAPSLITLTLAACGAGLLAIGIGILVAQAYQWFVRPQPRPTCRDNWHGEHAAPDRRRSDGARGRATIMAGQMLGDRSRRGWSTRSRKFEALRMARIDADVKACLAMDGGAK
jgi:hypothetical protein